MWSDFLNWTCKLDATTDLEPARDRKLRVAAELSQALRADPSSTEWASSLVAALQKSKLLFWRRVAFVEDLARARPVEFSRAIDELLTAGPSGLTAFRERLNELGDDSLDIGGTTAVGSVLLMSSHPENYPPYRVKFVNKWAELVGQDKPLDTPNDRYATLLRLCDELQEQGARAGLSLDSALEAQGLAWAVLNSEPHGWSAEEVSELRRWRGDPEPAPSTPRAWLVRPSNTGGLAERWVSEGFVSLSATLLGRPEPGSTEKHIEQAVRAGYQHLDYAQQAALTREYFVFLSRMRPGDLVATIDHDQLLVGRIADEPDYGDIEGSRLRRPVEWQSTRTPREKLPAPLPSLLDQQGNVVDLTRAYDLLAQLMDSQPSVDPAPQTDVPIPVDSVPRLPAATLDLCRKTYLGQEDLQEVIDLLQTRQQLVLYGPPGTGKTYVAQELAQHLVGADHQDRVQLVQFHPSYAYEDFFEGFRPTVKHGQATFDIAPGPLRLIAGAAANPENRGKPFVLIIDELNRANLAKVFGELYFLLEYRNRSIQLQYQPTEAFSLPRNLFIIGTMNTADRSIAMVDAAIRRRFPFVELHPSDGMAANVLQGFVEANKIDDDRVALLNALNAAIGSEGRDFHVGPSYLMRSEIVDDRSLARVWKYDILPLLEEHFAGQLDRSAVHSRFGLEALRAKLASGPDLSVA